MFRALSPIVCAASLLVGLAACDSLGRDFVAHSRCFDPVKEEFFCCDEYTPRDHPACNDAGADAGADASEDGETDASADDGGPPALECPWACTPVGGAGYGPFPSYVWWGPEDVPPPPPLDGFVWKAAIDFVFFSPDCPTCSCVAPTNLSDGCVLPSVWSVESTVCQDPSSATVTPFDAPLNWGGSCTSTNPIPEGILCDGESCVKSLVLQPPTIAPCIADPAMPPEPLPPPAHKNAVEYVTASTGQTCGPISNCITPPPPGYTLCFVANDVDPALPCPEGWTDRHTGWRDFTDTRECSACTCGTPEGASCEVRASVYADDACADERGSVVLSSTEGAKCVDVPAGTALGSKDAEVLSYQAGTCAPSTSEVIGEFHGTHPVTYCCLPPLPAPK